MRLMLAVRGIKRVINPATMGFLTTVTIRHDFLGQYENNHALLGKDILEGIDHAARECLTYRGNSLIVHPSHHADGPIIYVAHNGGTRQLTCRELKALSESAPEIARELVDVAKREVAFMDKWLKELHTDGAKPKDARRLRKPKQI